MPNPLEVICPTCSAAAGAACTRLNGTAMPMPHTKRVLAATEMPDGKSQRVPIRKTRRSG